MTAFPLAELLAARARLGRPYFEFLRAPALSAGLYVLPANAADPQHPHSEDEVYCVLSGRGRLSIGDADHEMEPGAVAYVPAGVPHRFHTITEELRVLVVFAPAESGPAA
ncbi:MAG: cupin domain-containing protein [Gemmatimonadales bacterium]